MPYEIPQNLKYKEKIAFGLSLNQLFWVGIFGAVAALVFFKTPFNIYVRGFVSLLLMGIGIGFAFLDLLSHIKTFKNYRKSIGEAGYLDKRLQDFIEVKKVEGNAIYLKNGSPRAAIEVTPINFGILGAEEQKAVIHAYKDFLNSLDFPIQIVMRTTNLNIDDYLYELRKSALEQKNPEIEKQFESFKNFVHEFIKENDVKNRLFYVIIPYSAYSNSRPVTDSINFIKSVFGGKKTKSSVEINRDNAQSQLNIRAKLCEEKLKKCGLFTKRLNDEQLLSLLASFFDSYIQTENDYFSPMTTVQKFEEVKT